MYRPLCAPSALQFAACTEVPLDWRRLVTLATYLGARAGELEALEWDDIDLAHGKVTIHRAVDRDRTGTKSVNNKEPRTFGVESELLPLLGAMHKEAGGSGRVVMMPRVRDLAELLRYFVAAAGVTRAELFASDATRIGLRFHDLRATAVTWWAVRGDGAERIWARTGHEDWPTMRKYMRVAESLGAGFGSVFPPLPTQLLARLPRIDPQSIRGITRNSLGIRKDYGNSSGADGTRTRGLRRDRPAL